MQLTNKLFSTVVALLIASPFVACSAFDASSSKLSGDQTQSGDCTLTQGYWKNHPDAWPVSSLELGTVTYTKDELIAILETPVKGNGLIQLAHQLIAAKLNIAAGASDTAIRDTIAEADALIGSLLVGTDYLAPSQTSALNDKLDEFNSGDIGPGHCGEESCGSAGTCGPVCGNGTQETGEECDDGNTTNGDGCSSTCTVEGPHCGNGVKETGEGCDDGNTTNGDGCSSTCTVEGPVCGNGIIEAGETCDDGNTVNGDGCSSTCICEHAVCGNGVKETGEECDDGNTTNGDGCSSTCTVELGPVCGNGIKETGEECDDGNTTSGDGCSSTCMCECTH